MSSCLIVSHESTDTSVSNVHIELETDYGCAPKFITGVDPILGFLAVDVYVHAYICASLSALD